MPELELKAEKQLEQQWVCLKCGRVGEFRCLGKGFLICSGCDYSHTLRE